MGRKAQDNRDKVERMIRFPNPLYRDLHARAQSENRSIQGQVIEAVQQMLAKEAK